MLILLYAISTIYLIIGDYGDAIFMFIAILLVSAISFYQDHRSKKALEALQKLNEPLSKVIREGKVIDIPTTEIVVGDLCITQEGKMISADGSIVHSNDLSVNEASLTGESLPVYKSSQSEDNNLYSGTLTVSGFAIFKVEKVGRESRIGKISTLLSEIKEEESPLQIQIRKFVTVMVIIGIIIFLAMCLFNYYQSGRLIESLLRGLTLAMSILPEEIPVAFTTFLALGAWKLMRDGVIIKRSNAVETLGSITVICTDKTGTITENNMHLTALYDHKSDLVFNEDNFIDEKVSTLITYAMWSSEPVPFDPMEKTLHQVYEQTQKKDDRKKYNMYFEYPLEGKPPMMTHILENREKQRIIAAKGAPEAILKVSNLTDAEKNHIRSIIKKFGSQGNRILGVAKTEFKNDNFPEKQQDLLFDFLGLVIFFDPPKKGIKEVFSHIYDAGIKVKVITGDNSDTTRSIAMQAGINFAQAPIEGQEVMTLSHPELEKAAEEKVLFTRMFPEAKLAIVDVLKKQGEIVAMLGDGVNDGPALKAAHIGVAMGNKGTEIAKAAASLVIIDDDLGKLIIGIAAGRRIYSNIKKAVRYIISIHIPIILLVSLPLFLGWVYPVIFTPVHVIFFELIMGPTCSIVYENEPMEKNMMLRPPRKMTETFLNWKELLTSIIQGLAIAVGAMFIYQYSSQNGAGEEKTRAIVFTTMIFANIILSLTNRSFFYSILESFNNKNSLFPVIILITLTLLSIILYYPPVTRFFMLTPLLPKELAIAAIVSSLSVLWFEVFKVIRRNQK